MVKLTEIRNEFKKCKNHNSDEKFIVKDYSKLNLQVKYINLSR